MSKEENDMKAITHSSDGEGKKKKREREIKVNGWTWTIDALHALRSFFSLLIPEHFGHFFCSPSMWTLYSLEMPTNNYLDFRNFFLRNRFSFRVMAFPFGVQFISCFFSRFECFVSFFPAFLPKIIVIVNIDGFLSIQTINRGTIMKRLPLTQTHSNRAWNSVLLFSFSMHIFRYIVSASTWK